MINGLVHVLISFETFSDRKHGPFNREVSLRRDQDSETEIEIDQ